MPTLDQPRQNLTDRERRDRLRLIRSDNIGPRAFHALIRRFGTAAAALEALPTLAKRGGGARIRIATEDDAARELAACARLGIRLVASGEAGYPPHLAAAEGAPPLLAIRGDGEVLMRPMIAIVGSRNASGAGLNFARLIARQLGDAGLVVISGLARGIDGAAHRATLETGTVAVLAGGQDCIYPPEHLELHAAIVSGRGAAISEMPLGHVPRAKDFPRRNRLISGAALGVVVVEAALRSGSLITARYAAEQGREVFAAPGSPLDPRAAGTNELLKQGAQIVTEADDVLRAIAPLLRRAPNWPAAERDSDDFALEEPGDSERLRIVSLLGPSPIGIDDLVRLAEVPAATVRMALLELELAGRLERHGGGLVSLR